MNIRRIILLAAAVAGALGAFGGVAARAQTIAGLSRRPVDTVDAQRVRIWFARETVGRCRVTINIVDDSGTVVRHLVNFLAPKGYYNFYWDKRDDSGRRVPAGAYVYQLENCGTKTTGTLEARYSRWEKAIDFAPYDKSNPGKLTVTIAADSVPVSLWVCSQQGRPLDSVFVDSVFNRGTYPIRVDPDSLGLHYGNFELRVTAGDYTYVREVTFLQ